MYFSDFGFPILCTICHGVPWYQVNLLVDFVGPWLFTALPTFVTVFWNWFPFQLPLVPPELQLTSNCRSWSWRWKENGSRFWFLSQSALGFWLVLESRLRLLHFGTWVLLIGQIWNDSTCFSWIRQGWLSAAWPQLPWMRAADRWCSASWTMWCSWGHPRQRLNFYAMRLG